MEEWKSNRKERRTKKKMKDRGRRRSEKDERYETETIGYYKNLLDKERCKAKGIPGKIQWLHQLSNEPNFITISRRVKHYAIRHDSR